MFLFDFANKSDDEVAPVIQNAASFITILDSSSQSSSFTFEDTTASWCN